MNYTPAPTQAKTIEELRRYTLAELYRVAGSLKTPAGNAIEVVDTLPTAENFEGRVVYLTTDDKLYLHDGSAWAPVTDDALASQLAAETAARISGDNALSASIGSLAATVNSNTASINNERAARQAADAALTATVNGNTAAITNEQTVRANADNALASSISSLNATVNGNTAAITSEQTARANADNALASSISSLNATVNGNTAAITSEQTARANADSALASNITALTATVNGNAAAISTESTARANADSALATQITTLTATVDDNSAAIINEQTVRADADNALAAQITQLTVQGGAVVMTYAQPNAPGNPNIGDLWFDTSTPANVPKRWSGFAWVPLSDAGVVANAAAIATEQVARIDGDSALASDITNLAAVVSTNNSTAQAAISNEQTARATADSAMASQISTLTTTVNGNTASVNTLASSVNGLQARYGVSLNVNGHITGFVQNNDGQTGSFTILADRFAIVAPGASPQTPFEVSGGVVRIKEANIGSLNVGKLTTGVLTAGITQNGDWSVGTGRIIWDNGSHMKVAGVGFGSNNQFIEWFGPKVPIAQCTEANAITYLKTNGDAYFGGSLSAGILRNAATVTGIGPAEQIVLGPFGSNGGARTVVLSYNYSNNIGITDAASWTGAPSASVVLERANGSGGWTQISVLNVTGSVSGQDGFGEFEPGFIQIGMAGSTTFVDNSGGLNVTYRGRIVSRTLPTINSTISSSSFFTPNQGVTVVSTEG